MTGGIEVPTRIASVTPPTRPCLGAEGMRSRTSGDLCITVGDVEMPTVTAARSGFADSPTPEVHGGTSGLDADAGRVGTGLDRRTPQRDRHRRAGRPERIGRQGDLGRQRLSDAKRREHARRPSLRRPQEED